MCTDAPPNGAPSGPDTTPSTTADLGGGVLNTNSKPVTSPEMARSRESLARHFPKNAFTEPFPAARRSKNEPSFAVEVESDDPDEPSGDPENPLTSTPSSGAPASLTTTPDTTKTESAARESGTLDNKPANKTTTTANTNETKRVTGTTTPQCDATKQ
ncbi:MAG: hypothetical protein WDA16_08490 [Candidatus Thermoplasmatota archaeon]